ncbi:MAG: DNA helicase RecQ [Phycisphaeraceae bacterium]|nr:DNA helicase RecQ [Phycisphaeraceae bacterium]
MGPMDSDRHVSSGRPGGDEAALRVLREVFGYRSFRGRQADVIEHIIQGGDCLVVMPTGGGKSLCFQIPAIVRRGVGLVVSPLIALMQDQVSALRQLGVRAEFINSTLTLSGIREVESAACRGELDLLYIAPERLMQPRTLELLSRVNLALIAVDEAHCISRWGHDFRPEYLQLGRLGEHFGTVPRLALTATADSTTREDILTRLDLTGAKQFISGFDRPNIHYRVVEKLNPRKQLLDFLKGEHSGDSGIVYCLSRRKVDETAAWLGTQGLSAVPYHAGMDAAARRAHQDRFRQEDSVIVVATIAFGMGIDKPDVRFVAHLDLPRSVEAYYQETGRAGRDGLPANAWMTYGYADAVVHQQFIERSEAPPEQKRIERAKLQAMLTYCESAVCRRKVLLEYFGESHGGRCNGCDTCSSPPERIDGTEMARKALSCIYRTDQTFGAGYLADVLLGVENERILHNRHHLLSTFGIGKDRSRREWIMLLRQLVVSGHLRADPEFGVLKLTAESIPLLRGERRFEMRIAAKPPNRRIAGDRSRHESAEKPPAAIEALQSASQRRLFDRLKEARLKIARAQNVPPYVIFHDRTLAEIVMAQPRSLDELAGIHGVGKQKLKRYGEQVLDVLLDEEP